MKRVTVTMEVDLGLFPDEADFSQARILQIGTVVERSLMVETPVQIVIEDIDTGLLKLIQIGETRT
jgi:hypothetical protein